MGCCCATTTHASLDDVNATLPTNTQQTQNHLDPKTPTDSATDKESRFVSNQSRFIAPILVASKQSIDTGTESETVRTVEGVDYVGLESGNLVNHDLLHKNHDSVQKNHDTEKYDEKINNESKFLVKSDFNLMEERKTGNEKIENESQMNRKNQENDFLNVNAIDNENQNMIVIDSVKPPSLSRKEASVHARSMSFSDSNLGIAPPAVKKKVSKKIKVKVVYENVTKEITTSELLNGVPKNTVDSGNLVVGAVAVPTAAISLPEMSPNNNSFIDEKSIALVDSEFGAVKLKKVFAQEVKEASSFLGYFHDSLTGNQVVVSHVNGNKYACLFSNGDNKHVEYSRGHVKSDNDSGFECKDGTIVFNNNASRFCWFKISGKYWSEKDRSFIEVVNTDSNNYFALLASSTIEFTYTNGIVQSLNEMGTIDSDGTIVWANSAWLRVHDPVGQYFDSKYGTAIEISWNKGAFFWGTFSSGEKFQLEFNGKLLLESGLDGSFRTDGSVAWKDGSSWFQVAGHFSDVGTAADVVVFAEKDFYKAYFSSGSDFTFTFFNGLIEGIHSGKMNLNGGIDWADGNSWLRL